jgi:hypothetical protein
MRRPNLLQRPLVCLIVFAIAQGSLQAASPFVSVGGNVTNFTVPGTIVATSARAMNNLGQVIGDYDDENGGMVFYALPTAPHVPD